MLHSGYFYVQSFELYSDNLRDLRLHIVNMLIIFFFLMDTKSMVKLGRVQNREADDDGSS